MTSLWVEPVALYNARKQIAGSFIFGLCHLLRVQFSFGQMDRLKPNRKLIKVVVCTVLVLTEKLKHPYDVLNPFGLGFLVASLPIRYMEVFFIQQHSLAVLVILIANVLRKEDIRTVKWPQSVTLGYNATSYFLRKPLACSIQLNLNLFLFNPFSLAFVPYAEVGESHFYKNHRNVLFLNRETYWYKFQLQGNRIVLRNFWMGTAKL